MFDHMDEKQLQAMHDVLDAMNTMRKIEVQMCNPDREGIIQVLLEAKQKAQPEISTLEMMNGEYQIFPPEAFSNEQLYAKLRQYWFGLQTYCINKVGEQLYNQLKNER